jgi:multidrug efflux pump subunit AcrA (membrane-fusion protein)
MNLLGKVFTLLTLILSVVFFIVSVMVNATHIDQRAKATASKAEADKANQEKATLQEKLEQTKRELAIEQMARRTALASLQTQVSQIAADLTEKEKQLRDLTSAHTTLVATEKTTTETLKTRITENDLLREQIKSARQDRDQIFQRLVGMKDTFNRLQGDYDRLFERHAELNNNYNLAAEKFQALGIKPDTDLGVPPAVNGTVLAVATNGLLQVSLGHDDGIRENMELDVHRGGSYIGKVKVTKVTPNNSIAEVLTKYQKGYVQAGDRVDSKLYK